MTDRARSGLVLFGHHGYLEAERKLGQRFLVDLWVDVDDAAAASDDIEHTVDYRHLAALVREVFARPGAPAARGARRGGRRTASSSASQTVERVAVRVRKPDVVLDPPVEHAAVIVERTPRVTRAYVGLGANLGPQEVTILRAVELLGAEPEIERPRALASSGRRSRSGSSTSRRS